MIFREKFREIFMGMCENLLIYFRKILRNSKQFRQIFVFREILKMLFRSQPSCNVNPDSGIGTKLHESRKM